MVEKPNAPAEPNNSNGGGDSEDPLKGAAAADTWAKGIALAVLLGGLLYCVVCGGLLEWSHNLPFQTEANFALFAAFIVVAGAIERFLEPLTSVLPPFKKVDDAASKADRALLSYSIALLVGIAVSSLFGLYFLETIGVEIGTLEGTGAAAKWVFGSDGDKALRGADIFITALIITGGTKPLHDMITSIEKKKEVLKGAAGSTQ